LKKSLKKNSSEKKGRILTYEKEKTTSWGQMESKKREKAPREIVILIKEKKENRSE